MQLRLAALLCVTLPALTAATMYRCRGNRFRYVRPGSSLLLDSRGTRWDGAKCFNAYTDHGYQLLIDCSAPGRYFETYPYCYSGANLFRFYPYGGKEIAGCGTHNTLKLTSDGRYFYSMFENRYGYNYYYKGIKCDVRAVKPGESTTTTEGTTITTGETTTTTSDTTTTTEETTTTTEETTTTTTLATTTSTATVAPKCSCGKHNKDESRIVNGQETKPHEYPFFAALVRKGSSHVFCGGSLISDIWVLSASHCVVYTAARTQVVLGGHDMDRPESSRQFIDVASVIRHENYIAAQVKNDIALYKLARPVTFTSQISPVCLPPKSFTDDLYKTDATVMGYGHTSHKGTGTRVLHDVQVKLMSYTDCRNFGSYYGALVTQDNICTYTVGKDSCQGDSGGPLVYDKNDRLTQIGVVSWGLECASVNKPGVFAKVENFLGWIHEKTSNTICRE